VQDPSVAVPRVQLGNTPLPVTFTLPLPPGVAKKVIVSERLSRAVGVNTMRTVQLEYEVRVVTPEAQSPVAPV
jgi:hypothetical protein